jgi:hypothetical protein
LIPAVRGCARPIWGLAQRFERHTVRARIGREGAAGRQDGMRGEGRHRSDPFRPHDDCANIDRW